MSDSEDPAQAAQIPQDTEIEQCLRRVVREALKNGDEITINLARSRAENELDLEAGFFKNSEQWKSRSKELINAAVEEPSSPAQPKKNASTELNLKKGTKRKSDESQKQRKRAKKSPVVESDEEESASVNGKTIEHEDSGELKPVPQSKSEEESALSDVPDDESIPAELKTNGKAAPDDDSSELSSVIDDPPPKQKRKSRPGSAPSAKSKSKPKSAKPSKATAKVSSAKDLSPDEEEIKRLQSWLLKCGIRKLWHRELASCSTSKEKIKHLKGMLDDVGMTGRYSAEKAKQIKEARELAAELEAAKEFNEQWGHESDEEDGKAEEKAPPRRLKPKGLVDFGDDDDDDDSD